MDAGFVGLRAGLLLLLAGLGLEAVGRLDLVVYASFGVFASVYGGAAASPGRWRVQGGLGLLLTAAVVSGVAVAMSRGRVWLAIPVTAVWAMGSAALWDRFQWRPPGPMFPVFAVATCASIPAVPSLVVAAAATTAGTAGSAVVLGAFKVRLRSREGVGPAAHRSGMAHPPHRRRIQALRCAVAVVVAGCVATSIGIDRAYWAMVAAIVPLAAPDLRAQLLRGVHRAVGTVAGLAVAAALLWVTLAPAVVVVLVALLQAVTELLAGRVYALALVFITPLALLQVQLASPQPAGSLLLDRFLETAIGVAIGIVVAVATRARQG